MSLLDAGFEVAAGFVALGILWLFVAGVLLGFVDWMRRFLG